VDIDPAEIARPGSRRSDCGRREPGADAPAQDAARSPEPARRKDRRGAACVVETNPRVEAAASLEPSLLERDQTAAPDAEIDRISAARLSFRATWGNTRCGGAVDPLQPPALWLNSGGLGSMGFGLPAAMGAQFANPTSWFSHRGRRRFPDVDSGAATMRATAAGQIIVMNTATWAWCASGRPCSTTTGCAAWNWIASDVEKLAGAYGFKGKIVDQPSQLAPALEAAVREPGPTC